jgi:membrane protein DedA with SNARE-associated domain
MVSVPTSAVWAVTMTVVGYAGSTVYEALSRWLGVGSVGVLVAVVAVAGVVIHRAGRTRPDS